MTTPHRNSEEAPRGSGATGSAPKVEGPLADFESERDFADAAVVLGVARLRSCYLDDGEVSAPPQIQLVSGCHSGAA